MDVMELIVIGMRRVVAEHRSIPTQDRRVGISRSLHAGFLGDPIDNGQTLGYINAQSALAGDASLHQELPVTQVTEQQFLGEDKAFAEELLHKGRVYLQIRAESVWPVFTAAHLSSGRFVPVPSLEEKKPLRNIGRFGLLPSAKALM